VPEGTQLREDPYGSTWSLSGPALHEITNGVVEVDFGVAEVVVTAKPHQPRAWPDQAAIEKPSHLF
jgi:hypothetical protein